MNRIELRQRRLGGFRVVAKRRQRFVAQLEVGRELGRGDRGALASLALQCNRHPAIEVCTGDRPDRSWSTSRYSAWRKA